MLCRIPGCILGSILRCIPGCIPGCILSCIPGCILRYILDCILACILGCILGCISGCIPGCILGCILGCIPGCIPGTSENLNLLERRLQTAPGEILDLFQAPQTSDFFVRRYGSANLNGAHHRLVRLKDVSSKNPFQLVHVLLFLP